MCHVSHLFPINDNPTLSHFFLFFSFSFMGAKQSKYHRSTRQNSLRRKSVNTTSANHSANTSSNTTTSVTIDGRQYHNESSAYILPKDEIEQDRLNSVKK